jgi:hypothetical protein
VKFLIIYYILDIDTFLSLLFVKFGYLYLFFRIREHLSCVHEKGEIIIVVHYIYWIVLLEGVNLYHLAFKCQCTCWWPELFSLLNAHACTCTWQCLPLHPWGHRRPVWLMKVKVYEKQNPACTFSVGFCSLNRHSLLSYLRVTFLRSWFCWDVAPHYWVIDIWPETF